jgi:DNA polymerase-3 subunit epsilon
VYVELIGARQAQLVLSQAVGPSLTNGEPIIVRQRPVPLVSAVTEEDRTAHHAFIATLGENAIWRDYLGA